jgi:fluoride exporter
MSVLLVVVGAVIGAPARFLTDLVVQSRHRWQLPLGTLTVNVAGSLVLGVIAGAVAAGHATSDAMTVVGTGLCGALTTFSTFSYETVRLLEDGRWRTAVGNVVASLVAGLAAVSLGWWLGGL